MGSIRNTQPHIVFMNMSATGHMNPSLPVVANLVARGCKVTYFVEVTMKEVVEGAGASWQPFRYPSGDFTGILRNPSDFEKLDASQLAAVGVPPGTPLEQHGFPWCSVYNAQLVLPNLIEDLRAMHPAPSAIVYEPFLAGALVAAHVLKIPAISLFTMPGPGVLSFPEGLMKDQEDKEWVQKPRQWILDHYGLDLFKNGSMMEFYSPQFNFVTTVKSLYQPPTSDHQVQRFGHFTFQCVGPLVDSAVKRIQNAGDGSTGALLSDSNYNASDSHSALDMTALKAPLPLDKVREMRNAGRRVVLISLGTVATQRMWNKTLGVAPMKNDDRPEGARSIMDYTGKEFCQMVYRICFQVLEQDPTVFAIFSLGTNGQDALDGLPSPPSNVVLRESVSQIELLTLCDAFVTHGGANSMHEALSMRVPLAVVPVFGDQMANADSVARCGAGFSFRHPLMTLSVATLSDALEKLLSPDPDNSFRMAASSMAEEMAQAGGVPRAVNAILELVPTGLPLPTLLQPAFPSAGNKAAMPSVSLKKQVHETEGACDA